MSGNQLEASHGPAYVVKEIFSVSLFATVSAIMNVPCLFGYAAVIFGGSPVYQPYLPLLGKLLVLSSAVQQLFCSLVSPLPFVIGQVQGAGEHVALFRPTAPANGIASHA